MSVPQLYFQPGGIAQKVLDRCTAIKQPFNPTMWAPNPHIQSALGRTFVAESTLAGSSGMQPCMCNRRFLTVLTAATAVCR